MDRFLVRRVTEGQAATTEGQASNKATRSQDTGKQIQKRKRKHNEEYIKYGFTVTTDRAGEEVPMCFVCSTLLSTEAIKPSKLLRHMETHHVFLNAKPIEYMCQPYGRLFRFFGMPRTQKYHKGAVYKYLYLELKH